MKIYVLTCSYNDYNQHGAVFKCLYFEKPTIEMLSRNCGISIEQAEMLSTNSYLVLYGDCSWDLLIFDKEEIEILKAFGTEKLISEQKMYSKYCDIVINTKTKEISNFTKKYKPKYLKYIRHNGVWQNTFIIELLKQSDELILYVVGMEIHMSGDYHLAYERIKEWYFKIKK